MFKNIRTSWNGISLIYIFQLHIHSDFIHQPHLSGRLGQFCLHFPTLRKDASPKRDLDNEVVWEWAPRHPDQTWWKKKLEINVEVSELWSKFTPDSSKPTIGECRWYCWCFRNFCDETTPQIYKNLRQTWGDQPPILNWCWPNFWTINSSLERQVGLSFITQVEECRLQNLAYIYVHSLYIIERLLSVRTRVISPSSLEDDSSIVARW